MSNIIEELESEQMTREIPEFGPGDTVVVQVKVKEGNRERLQAFDVRRAKLYYLRELTGKAARIKEKV